MSLYEFDEERHNRTLREEGIEEGIEIGIGKGIWEGRNALLNEFLSDETITPERAEALRQSAVMNV